MKRGTEEDYELKFLRIENEKLKKELEFGSKKKLSEGMQKDIENLLKISMRMKELLEICRQQTLPIELGRQIDRVIKEIENY